MRRFVWAWSSLLALVLSGTSLTAQEAAVITGRVTNEAGEGVAAATVGIASLNVSAATNAQGNYTLNIPASRINAGQQVQISASRVGLSAQTRTVALNPGDNLTQNFRLGAEALALEGLVVTALGIERQERELGVAATSVKGEELSRVETNIVNTLSGKVAGVNITNAGPQGGSSRIVIRGENSITGDNQPLFIVDGVPIDNYSTGKYMNSGQGGYDYGNAAQDIPPDAIQSITVLKGPNAAAIYGSRASNGAVIITTKKGRGAVGGGPEITVSQNVSFESELRLPDYQNQFGQGLYGQYEYFDGDNNGIYDGEDQSWGPPLDQGLMIPQWNSPIDPATGQRIATPWVSSPNNVDEFFELGRTLNTNVSVAAGNETMHGRFGVAYLDQDGMVPGFGLRRLTTSFGGGMDVTDRLNVNTSIQYIDAAGQNRPGTGYSSDNPMSQFVWFGRQVDTRQLRQNWNEVFPEGDPNEGLPQNWQRHYWSNPYYIQYAGKNEDTRDRLIGQLSAGYQLTDWLNATVSSGTDRYQDRRLKAYAPDTYGGLYTTNPLTVEREYVGSTGAFGNWEIGFQETNSSFLLNANPETNLPFSVSATFGGNRRDVERITDYVWVGSLATPGIYDVGNAAIEPDPFTFTSRKRVNSLYGQTDFGFNDLLFVTLTGRNDWSSTLPESDRSYFYPSVSTSLIVSDAIPALANSPFLTYGKLRASWAQVGNDTDPYQLRNTFTADQKFGALPTFEIPGQLNNENLKPETTESWEFGTELGFLDNRLGLDLTYYNEKTFDQIMPVSLSRATGYTSRVVNAGTVQNKGWEVLLRGTPIRTGDFRWESTLTWAKNDNLVLELAEGVEGLELSLGDFWGAQVFARKGEPLGQIVGTDYLRVEDRNSPYYGERIIHPIGIHRWTPEPKVLGNFNPDWRAGISNEFSYKGARLNFLFDIKHGGEIYSVTKMFGSYAGVLAETVKGRCTPAGDLEPGQAPPVGYPICTAETGLVPAGVQRRITNNGADTTYFANTPEGVAAAGGELIIVDSETYQLTQYYVGASNIMDAGFVKLRELAFTYDLPGRFSDRLGLSGLQLGVIGRNLALWTDNPHIDPESAFDNSNIQGFEYGQMPTARSIGFNITVRP